MVIFTHHVQFWVGLFSGGTLGYLFGARVKAGIFAELEALRTIVRDLRKTV